jgi:hypothetical protein
VAGLGVLAGTVLVGSMLVGTVLPSVATAPAGALSGRPHLAAAGRPVLGLGDSVAAGYGLGPSQGSPDNPSAYPSLLARALGSTAQNDAAQGACAGVEEPNCPAQSVAWQIAHVPATFHPGTVTLTVGANDIDFAGCLKALFDPSHPDLSLQAPSDPCNPTNLAPRLAALRVALRGDLQTLVEKYPTATVLVMAYYDPFPPAPSSGQSPCSLDEALTPFVAHSLGERWWREGADAVLGRGTFARQAAAVQGQISTDATMVIDRLNSSIAAAAGGGLAEVVGTGNFTGHDICAAGQPWIFAPDLSVRTTVLGRSTGVDFGGTTVCPAPVARADWTLHKDVAFVGGSLEFNVGVNCLPHPTAAGQAALCTDFLARTGAVGTCATTTPAVTLRRNGPDPV